MLGLEKNSYEFQNRFVSLISCVGFVYKIMLRFIELSEKGFIEFEVNVNLTL